MTKKPYKAESKKLMDMLIHSVYTNKEIFLRELISNGSDALDKLYYKTLDDPEKTFNREDYYMELEVDRKRRTLTLRDTGLGMNQEDLEDQLGTLAKSGSLAFKEDQDQAQDIIGQFGIGFYSAFLVADKVQVLSKKYGEDQAYLWESEGPEGYSIVEAEKEGHGTAITLYLKEDKDEETYGEFLEDYRLEDLVKRYSNYIRYPIKMEVTRRRALDQEGEEPGYETYQEVQVLNSMVPIWQKNKQELKEEDYRQFYRDQHYGFEDPLDWIHINVEGLISYRAILYIPGVKPFDYQTKAYEKGLQLYSKGVLIMDRCEKLLPDALSFIRGVVDSEDLSLNISREILQEDRQLAHISKNIENKVLSHLKKIMDKDRAKYETFYNNFGESLKLSIYESYGAHKDKVQDLLLFYSARQGGLVSLAQYLEAMGEDQDKIYYQGGESLDHLAKMPQRAYYDQKGWDILFLTHPMDEFVLKIMGDYQGKAFQSISQEEEGQEDPEKPDLLKKIGALLDGRVVAVRWSDRLGDNPVSLVARGDISLEMERILTREGQLGLKAQKVLEINRNHPVHDKLEALKDQEEDLRAYSQILYDQAALIEGLPLEDPVAYAKTIWKFMK
ncbi:MAG: molecular chaperone HtpG [Tissierellia bacterium]|nr:molecular chaperone HtpG [Tissierellia bacterium]